MSNFSRSGLTQKFPKSLIYRRREAASRRVPPSRRERQEIVESV
ncbi:hypothetical protein [Nostoc sp. FACHB-190]|nr:hypothetical protein [Nostoc sp. FACHB-190]